MKGYIYMYLYGLYGLFFQNLLTDFMVKAIKMVMLKESMLVVLKEDNMEYSRVPELVQKYVLKIKISFLI